MAALILPSRLNRQPQQPAGLDLRNPMNLGMQGLIVANRGSNLVTQVPLRRSGTITPAAMTAGIVNQFRKNAYIETEVLPAIGTQSFLEFWCGYPSADLYAKGISQFDTNDPGFLTGSSANQLGLFQAVGSRYGTPMTQWGAVYNWNASNASTFNLSGETLTPGVFTVLISQRRAGGMELWRDGNQKSFTAQSPVSYPAESLICGAFVEDLGYWPSSNDMVMAGRLLGEWTPAQIRSFSANIWQLFKSPQRRLIVEAGPVSAITGTLFSAEGNDTATAAGTVIFQTVTGTLARSEGVDTAAATGSVTYPAITGTSAASEGADMAAAAGAVAYQAITGSASIAEVADSSAGTGSVTFQAITGTLSQSEQADTSTAAGVIGNVVAGSVIASESPDTATAAGSLTFPAITGTASRSEGADTLAAAGSVAYVAISGSMSAAEQADTALATGAVAYPGVTGIAIAFETADTLTASGTVGNALIGSMLATEQPDTAAAAGTLGAVPITGAAVATEGADTALSSGSLAYPAISGSMSRAEVPDVLAGTGLVLSIIVGAASTAEARDTAACYGIVTGGQAVIDASKIPPEHIVSFAGSVRVIPFPGTSRIVRF